MAFDLGQRFLRALTALVLGLVLAVAPLLEAKDLCCGPDSVPAVADCCGQVVPADGAFSHQEEDRDCGCAVDDGLLAYWLFPASGTGAPLASVAIVGTPVLLSSLACLGPAADLPGASPPPWQSHLPLYLQLGVLRC